MCCWQWPRYPPPCRVELETSSRRLGHPISRPASARPGPARPFLPRGGGRASPLPLPRSRPGHAGLRHLRRHLPAGPGGRRALPLPGNGGGGAARSRGRQRAAAGPGPARPLPSARDVAAGPGRACTLLGVSALRHPACNQPP